MALVAISFGVVGLLTNLDLAYYVGAGTWCGISFGLSGIFGIILICRPSLGLIITSLVFSTTSALFSLDLFVASIMGSIGYCRGDVIGCAFGHMFSWIQFFTSVIQAPVSIASARLTYKAFYEYCRPITKDHAATWYPDEAGQSTMIDSINQPLIVPEQQAGFIKIPT